MARYGLVLRGWLKWKLYAINLYLVCKPATMIIALIFKIKKYKNRTQWEWREGSEDLPSSYYHDNAFLLVISMVILAFPSLLTRNPEFWSLNPSHGHTDVIVAGWGLNLDLSDFIASCLSGHL